MYKLVTPAAEPIVDVDVARHHLNVEHQEDTSLILGLVAAATRYLEKQTARQFGVATWEMYLDRFPCGPDPGLSRCCVLPIEIRKCPVTDVTEVAYTDEAGDPQTVAGFQKDTISEPARVFPAYGEPWPLARCIPNAVKVTFTAGYPAVPDEAKQVVL